MTCQSCTVEPCPANAIITAHVNSTQTTLYQAYLLPNGCRAVHQGHTAYTAEGSRSWHGNQYP